MIRHRPLQFEDISTCVQIIAAHPVLGPRYGRSLAHLESAWRHVLGSDAFFLLPLTKRLLDSPKPSLPRSHVSLQIDLPPRS